MAKLFTEAELEELRRADAEIEEDFTLTQEDLNFSRNLDREAKLDKLDNRGRKIAAQQAAYREANREKWNAYQREYRRKRREEQKKAAPRSGNSDGRQDKGLLLLYKNWRESQWLIL